VGREISPNEENMKLFLQSGETVNLRRLKRQVVLDQPAHIPGSWWGYIQDDGWNRARYYRWWMEEDFDEYWERNPHLERPHDKAYLPSRVS